MSEERPIEKKLKEIFVSRRFEDLSPYYDETQWISLSALEKELLGILFAIYGEEQLFQGNSNALDHFKLAQKVAPDNPHVLYRLAEAYGAQKNNLRCLETASKLLDQAVNIDPRQERCWTLWGCILSRLSGLKEDVNYLYEAIKKFEVAEALTQVHATDTRTMLYWYWGLTLSQLGRASGEPQDFHQAINKYRNAAELGLTHHQFLIDYINSLIEFALLIGQAELLVDAIKLTDRLVAEHPGIFEGWFLRGCAALAIYQCSHLDAYLLLGLESFKQAASIEEQHFPLWVSWTKLLLVAGKQRQDLDLIEMSIEKIKKAYELDPENPPLLALWGEALILSGGITERLELLREGEAKLVHSLKLNAQDPHTWYIYGCCFTEMGRYFEDGQYYTQAIEKFRYGLTLKPNSPTLWHGYSLCCFVLGQLNADPEMLEQCISCCAKVLEFGGAQFLPQLWEDWGVALLELGEMRDDKAYVEAAIEKFERAIQYKNGTKAPHPDAALLHQYGTAWDLLGEMTDNPSHHEKAIAILSQATHLEPQNAEALYALAIAYTQLGENTQLPEYFQKAIEYFEKAASQEPETQDTWQEWGIALIKLAQLIAEPSHPEKNQHLYSEAEDKLLYAVGLGAISALYDLCGLYALTGNFNMAMHYIERCKAQGSLPPIEALMHDEWLENLRQTSEFRTFLGDSVP